MLFVLDAGNTNIVLGVYKNEKLIHHWRMETIRNRSADEYGMFIKNLLQNDGLKFDDFDGIIISSVVPPIMFSIERMCEKYFKIKPIVVGPGVKTGLNIKIENPREVGADRIVNAVSAIHEYGAPLILIDFGTATTYCYVDENKNYHGGAIAPGIGISTEALYTKAAKLPYIELTMPDNVIGKNTVAAMQSGILFGNVGQVEGIVARMSEQSAIKPTVIATGGLASLIASEAKCIDHVDPFLTLKGLHLIYKKNC
ncbi:MAG: pantothenate kinase [Bacillales bacterium]|jgi:type III pantothenate kinase|nr:pantothenate kinase [Bacillales bacterium]